ncbi:Lrp/AsnC family transcriptional regulator [Antrihabitans cavernicola]|uniref:Lrp/AsnC family transcriptional regulator n=1 Tax=Antrihabitans cavernicola TaxID=2495913 RepID=A0A5A7SA45_9NOCA|nr:Lrp/AsnC family transcriptional regulator [Spelaeibacter cavernicola]KAA0023048.1 Lrp/AsnC family transcriptional regulator [Spelaeibacter cavernicola]
MVTESADSPPTRGAAPNDVRDFALDSVDRVLIEQLQRDARTPNNALASLAGIAPSTALGRVRSLIDRGIIRGFHAAIDPAALGRNLEAMISVRLQAHARKHEAFTERMVGLDEVLDIYFIAGADDYLLHVAVASAHRLRDFVIEHLGADPEVAGTETTLIFEHLRRGPD